MKTRKIKLGWGKTASSRSMKGKEYPHPRLQETYGIIEQTEDTYHTDIEVIKWITYNSGRDATRIRVKSGYDEESYEFEKEGIVPHFKIIENVKNNNINGWIIL